jgi:hypothetical protein
LKASFSLIVVDEEVDSATGNTRDLALQGQVSNIGAESASTLAKTQEVGSESNNMRRGHGSTGEDSSATSVIGAGDGRARGKDIDDAAVVGVGSKAIRRGGCADGAGGRLRGRRLGAGVGSFVSGSDAEEDAGRDNVGSGRVERSRLGSAQGHVGNEALGAAAAGLGVTGDEVHASNDTGAMWIVSDLIL